MDLLIVTRPTVHLAMRRLTHTMVIGELDHLLQDKMKTLRCSLEAMETTTRSMHPMMIGDVV